MLVSMTEQLALLKDADTDYDRTRFVLDARTRRIGFAGLAKARAALALAHHEPTTSRAASGLGEAKAA